MNTVRDPILPTVPIITEEINPDIIRRWREDITEIIQTLHNSIYDDLITLSAECNKIEISDSDYTMSSSDEFDLYVFTGLTADRTFTVLPLHEGKRFSVVNFSDYTVACSPSGSNYLNDWNYKFDITEKGGELKFTGISDRWLVKPIGDACIYEASSETADAGLALDGTWDDVAGIELLNGVYGKGDLYAFANQGGIDASIPTYIILGWGIGKTSGNNAPDIKNNGYMLIYNIANSIEKVYVERQISKFPYESDGSTIYMKALIESNELNCTGHVCQGQSDMPMYIKFVRNY